MAGLPLATLVSAVSRKLRRLTGAQTDPYADIPKNVMLSPYSGLRAAMATVPRAMAFPAKGDAESLVQWQETARAELARLCGYESQRSVPTVTLEERSVAMADEVSRQTTYLRVRPDTDVPVTHLCRAGLSEDAPVFLYLAGSTSGVHLGWGEARVPIDHQRLGIGADIALQAARRGYRVFCIEQMGFGTREERVLAKRSQDRTIDAHNHALLLGQSLTGLRAMDVSSVVDWIRSGVAPCPAGVTLRMFGHSSGGTTAFYTAALDPRISATLASGCLGPIAATLGARGNPSGDGIVPGLMAKFDAADLVALVAPRAFVGLSGRDDHIYPYSGVAEVLDEARLAYAVLNATEALRAEKAPAGHQYYADESWAAWKAVIDPALPDDPKRPI